MECEVCLEELDLLERRPKFLPCGHTICQRCVRRLRDRLCPHCRKELPRDLSTLPDNYYVLKQLQPTPQKSSSRSWWCVTCCQVASPTCEESHTVQSLKATVRDQVNAISAKAPKELESTLKNIENCTEDRIPHVLKVLGATAGSSWHLTLKCDGGKSSYTADLKSATYGNILKALFVKKAIEGNLRETDSTSQEPKLEPNAVKKVQEETAATAAVSLGKTAHVNLKVNSSCGPLERLESKMHWLSTVRSRGVRRLSHVHCHMDPQWTLDVLRAAVLTVEIAELLHPRREHLTAVLTAPLLKRLTVVNAEHDTLYQDPPVAELAALGYNTIEYLSVTGAFGLPRDTLLAILRQHSASLQEFHLEVGTSRNGPGIAGPVSLLDWPRKCAILHDMLEDCQLIALKKLVLVRNNDDNALDHSKPHCKKQLDKLRKVLPGVEVLCESVECSFVVV